jgi:hypothetical protein
MKQLQFMVPINADFSEAITRQRVVSCTACVEVTCVREDVIQACAKQTTDLILKMIFINTI